MFHYRVMLGLANHTVTIGSLLDTYYTAIAYYQSGQVYQIAGSVVSMSPLDVSVSILYHT